MPIEIRALAVDDVLQWRDLRLRMLLEDPEGFHADLSESEALTEDEWRSRMPAMPDALFGLFVDGRLCGSAGFIREKRRKLAHKGMMVAVYVAPEQRGLGHATALVRAVVDHARGHVDVLQTGASTSGAPVYKKLGFQPYGIERDASRVGSQSFDNELMAIHFREPPK
jgi:RimJ/RimL family protein N-acetyltransferase